MPLGCISRVEKVGYSTVSRGEDSYGLEITCKDMRNIRFTHQQTNHSRRPLYENLQRFAFPASNKMNFFALSYKPEWTFDGWTVYEEILLPQQWLQLESPIKLDKYQQIHNDR